MRKLIQSVSEIETSYSQGVTRMKIKVGRDFLTCPSNAYKFLVLSKMSFYTFLVIMGDNKACDYLLKEACNCLPYHNR